MRVQPRFGFFGGTQDANLTKVVLRYNRKHLEHTEKSVTRSDYRTEAKAQSLAQIANFATDGFELAALWQVDNFSAIQQNVESVGTSRIIP